MRSTTRLRRAAAGIGAMAAAALVALFVPSPARAAPALDPSDSARDPGTAGPEATDPALGANVEAVCGNDGPGQFRCLSFVRTDLLDHNTLGPNAEPAGYHPEDLRDAYALPSATAGQDVTVAIVDAFDHPNIDTDLGVYRSQFGLPECSVDNGCFTKVDQNGGTDYPPMDPGWAWEIALDVDMVSAVCPNCRILLVESDGSLEGMGQAVDTAVELGAEYVSNSYGMRGGEAPEQLDLDHFYDHPGVGITVSTGDNGFGVSWPATSPTVTAVGGTSLLPADNERGWTETAWSGAGSGCSAFEPKPEVQTDTGCGANRTVADVSAIGDPNTGVSVYSSVPDPSHGIPAGWQVFGGTSASAPIIAGVYALAGLVPDGEYANTYPYTNPAGLRDVVGGSNGFCDPEYLCTGIEGFDGPTGLGTPNGTDSFARPTDFGHLVGTVTDAATGEPVSGATVTLDDRSTSTDTAGGYQIFTRAGTYELTVAAFGYATRTVPVEVLTGETVTVDVALTSTAHAVISGTVTDGGGQGWPLHAKITVAGVDTGPVWSDPFTGHYEVALPARATYTLTVSPDVPGYQVMTRDVEIGSGDVDQDFALVPDETECVAPGYAVNVAGVRTSFDSTDVPDGWSVTDNIDSGATWRFDAPGGVANQTGGAGGFAIVDSIFEGTGSFQDTDLVTPSIDMSDVASPGIGFRTDYRAFLDASTATIDYSLDGGATWTTVWERTNQALTGRQFIPVPEMAGRSDVRVRFHYVAHFSTWWQLDDVYVGERTCDPVPGGLVVGHVTDRNTGAAVNRVTVTSDSGGSGTSASSADPAVGDGYYSLVTSGTGAHEFTAAKPGYTDAARTVNVSPHLVNRLDVSLGAGHLVVTPGSVMGEQGMGETATHTVQFTNDGDAPVEVTLGGRDGDFEEMLDRPGAPVEHVTGEYSMYRASGTGATPPGADPAAAPWTNVADFPTAIMDNASVTTPDGRVYSVTGVVTGGALTNEGYVYDPAHDTWTGIADAPHARENAVAGTYDGKVYVMAGWGEVTDLEFATDVYDPVTDSWSPASNAPEPLAASGHAQVGSVVYLFGGCPSGQSCGTATSYSYDMATDTWTRIADYPEPVAWESCGAIDGAVYCAGGGTDLGSLVHTYRYDPETDSWSTRADMPVPLWGTAHSAANGKLLLSGGILGSGAITNEGYAYDPATNEWSALPASANATYRVGGACGLYRIGGSTGIFFPIDDVELLPGFDTCAPRPGWLSVEPGSFTVEPGATVEVTVTLDSTDAEVVDQPGDYNASLPIITDTPYSFAAVGVSMRVDPPATWGRLAGTVTGTSCGGSTVPLADATVQVDSWARSYLVRTDADGHYQVWLDWRNSPVTMIVFVDGWRAQFRMADIRAADTTTVNVTLRAIC